MFQDTLLIIKCDYLSQRKALLIHLLNRGFLIKGQRKINFTPELAAEFYQHLAQNPCFMFQVILLSKGNSEAFILCKENAVEDLLNTMVCYFGNSSEMEQNVHVTKCQSRLQKEISFIFPNYIYEPIQCPEQIKFCMNNPLVEATITHLYDIITKPEIDPHKTWKQKLAEFLLLSNKKLPQISNQCSYNTNLMAQDMSQQTKLTSIHHKKVLKEAEHKSHSDLNLSSDGGTSAALTTSSCITCSSFSSAADCQQQCYKQEAYENIIKARSAPLEVKESTSSSRSDLAKDTLEEWNIEEFIAVEDNILLEEDSEIQGDKIDNFVIADSIQSVIPSPPAEDLNLNLNDSVVEKVSEVMTHLEPVEGTAEENKSNLEIEPLVVKEASLTKVESVVKEPSLTKVESVVKESTAANEETIIKEASTTSIKKDNNEPEEKVSLASEKNAVHSTEDKPESNPE